MDERKVGGPAFPVHCDDWKGANEGMTLRDYFAAKALQALLSDTTTMANISKDARAAGVSPTIYVSGSAYDFADAMIAARGAI